MKAFKVLRLLMLAGIAPWLAAPSFAQDSYYYFGAGAGKSRTNLDAERIANDQVGSGLDITGLTRDNADNAYKVFLGYQFNRYVGLELGYFHLGQFKLHATTVPAGTLDGKVLVQGGSFDVVGTMPISENFSALGRIGAQVARTRDTFSGSGAVAVMNATPSERELNVKVGVGLQYAFSQSLMVRAEAERFRINDAMGNKPTVNLYTVSLVVPFGRSAAPASRVAMGSPAYAADAPAPVAMTAPAPAPEPVVAQAPAPAQAPVIRDVSYAAESMFSFDKATLHPEGMQALDAFALQLQGVQYDTITVKGYADRLGSDEYNQTLSLQRAEAVKAYLVNSGKLDASRISTVGLSESAPVTAPDECRGTEPTAALIRCLRPDRRVEITVTGTR